MTEQTRQYPGQANTAARATVSRLIVRFPAHRAPGTAAPADQAGVSCHHPRVLQAQLLRGRGGLRGGHARAGHRLVGLELAHLLRAQGSRARQALGSLGVGGGLLQLRLCLLQSRFGLCQIGLHGGVVKAGQQLSRAHRVAHLRHHLHQAQPADLAADDGL